MIQFTHIIMNIILKLDGGSALPFCSDAFMNEAPKVLYINTSYIASVDSITSNLHQYNRKIKRGPRVMKHPG